MEEMVGYHNIFTINAKYGVSHWPSEIFPSWSCILCSVAISINWKILGIWDLFQWDEGNDSRDPAEFRSLPHLLLSERNKS